jgi:hypothetical protein
LRKGDEREKKRKQSRHTTLWILERWAIIATYTCTTGLAVTYLQAAAAEERFSTIIEPLSPDTRYPMIFPVSTDLIALMVQEAAPAFVALANTPSNSRALPIVIITDLHFGSRLVKLLPPSGLFNGGSKFDQLPISGTFTEFAVVAK